MRIPVFASLAIVPGGHAPVTHQDQGYGTIREDPLEAPGSFEPQKTVGTRPPPIVGQKRYQDEFMGFVG